MSLNKPLKLGISFNNPLTNAHFKFSRKYLRLTSLHMQQCYRPKPSLWLHRQ